MVYYSYDEARQMPKKMDDALQRCFPDNKKWGACVNFNIDGSVDFIEICKLSDVTHKSSTWMHYATIGRYSSNDENNGKFWEVYSQFNGKAGDELWIFGYYKNFGDACRRVRLGIEKLKPIKIY